MQKRKMSAERGAPRLAAHALAGMVSGLASAFILFGLVAAVCCKVDIPPHLLLPLSTVAVSFAMLSRPGCSVVKWTGGFVGRSRTRMSGGRGE